ncbi:MAG TPA: heme-binding protein [Chitinophagaceae bacterium]|nr:heme-binding protein [Chitinophagaceae bacterium]
MEMEKISAAFLKAAQVAKKHAVAICLTIVDQGGHIVYQARMEDANYMTNEVSFLKAKTAFLFKCPTNTLRTIVEKLPFLLKTIEIVPGDAFMIEGGLPLVTDGRVIGGVGVSGGNFEQDLLIANAFVEFLNNN